MPRWFWLLPLLAMAAWWPIEPYWQSDDFLAVHYAQHGKDVLHDFVGPQYAATDVWLFYRPLITASFWLEQQLGGAWPPLSHCSNVLAHGISTLLVALLWRRFATDRQAFGAALLWAMLPSHAGSIAWAVGRVDSHTTVWCLLALLLCLRAQERAANGGRGVAWTAGLATAAALASKELAFVVPPLALLLVWLRNPHAPFASRTAGALTTTAPVWLAFGAYVPLRWLALGRFGGYDAAAYDAVAMLNGLGQNLAHLLVPLRWIGDPGAQFGLSSAWWLATAALPPVGALLLALLWQPRRVLAAASVLLVAMAPMATFLPAWENPQTQRYWYLPTAALCGVLALPGRVFVLAILLAWAWPLVAIRSAHHAADRQTAGMHAALLREVRDGAPAPMFVAGLPNANATGTVVQLHFGLDRLLLPPFSERAVPLYALRPLFASPLAFRLHADHEAPTALPLGSTWFFADPSALGKAPDPAPLPDLEVTGHDGGVLDLTSPRLFTLLQADPPHIRLQTPGVRPLAFRLTLFTANGYLATVFLDHGDGSGPDGTVDIRTWFAGRRPVPVPDGYVEYWIGRIATSDTFIGEVLDVPTTIDLVPEFPMLLEAGDVDLKTGGFTATHRARRLLTFRFDRGYRAWKLAAHGEK